LPKITNIAILQVPKTRYFSIQSLHLICKFFNHILVNNSGHHWRRLTCRQAPRGGGLKGERVGRLSSGGRVRFLSHSFCLTLNCCTKVLSLFCCLAGLLVWWFALACLLLFGACRFYSQVCFGLCVCFFIYIFFFARCFSTFAM